VKTVIAILFSVLLAGAQTVFTVDSSCPMAPAKSECGCSHCDKPACCAAKSNPLSQPRAPSPARDDSRNRSHLLADRVTPLLFSLPTPAAQESIALFAPSLTMTDIPLYARNCSYLL